MSAKQSSREEEMVTQHTDTAVPVRTTATPATSTLPRAGQSTPGGGSTQRRQKAAAARQPAELRAVRAAAELGGHLLAAGPQALGTVTRMEHSAWGA